MLQKASQQEFPIYSLQKTESSMLATNPSSYLWTEKELSDSHKPITRRGVGIVLLRGKSSRTPEPTPTRQHPAVRVRSPRIQRNPSSCASASSAAFAQLLVPRADWRVSPIWKNSPWGVSDSHSHSPRAQSRTRSTKPQPRIYKFHNRRRRAINKVVDKARERSLSIVCTTMTCERYNAVRRTRTRCNPTRRTGGMPCHTNRSPAVHGAAVFDYHCSMHRAYR
jgi:hypothetical protein